MFVFLVFGSTYVLELGEVGSFLLFASSVVFHDFGLALDKDEDVGRAYDEGAIVQTRTSGYTRKY